MDDPPCPLMEKLDPASVVIRSSDYEESKDYSEEVDEAKDVPAALPGPEVLSAFRAMRTQAARERRINSLSSPGEVSASLPVEERVPAPHTWQATGRGRELSPGVSAYLPPEERVPALVDFPAPRPWQSAGRAEEPPPCLPLPPPENGPVNGVWPSDCADPPTRVHCPHLDRIKAAVAGAFENNRTCLEDKHFLDFTAKLFSLS